jgi:acetate---CoA ligase (ADP-forming)
MAEDAGIDLPELSATTVEKLSTIKSDYLSLRNPLNAPERYVRRGDVFRQWIQTLVDDENLDIIGLRLPLPRRRVDEDVIARFHDLAEIAERTEKLVVLFSRASISLPEYWRKLLGENNIPFLLEYRRGFKALRALMDYDRFLKKSRVSSSEIRSSIDGGKSGRMIPANGRVLTERKGKQILAEYDIPMTREALAKNEEEARRVAETIGYPVVLKVESGDVTHKTEAGAVKINIQNEAEVRRCYHEILNNAQAYKPTAAVDGILVQEMITGGKELIVGMKRDPQFGPVIVVGMGGIFVEVIKDIAMRVAPLTKSDALDMIGELKAFPILKGLRGEAESDVDAVAEILCRFSRLSMDFVDEIAEIEINPLIVFETGRGAVAVDCLITLSDGHED